MYLPEEMAIDSVRLELHWYDEEESRSEGNLLVRAFTVVKSKDNYYINRTLIRD